MDCKEMIIEKLKALGADGLCTHMCGCGIDDLSPCENNFSMCRPAKKVRTQDLDDDYEDLREEAEACGWPDVFIEIEDSK